jgi:parallel beta-helix repeat protein
MLVAQTGERRMRRIVSGIILVLLFVDVLVLAFDVGLVRAQAPEIVTISSDGSVSPSSAPISSVDNVTYTFTGNMSYPSYYGIIVERNNVIVDGDGYTVQGNGNETVRDFSAGFDLTDTSNVTIENANIEDFVNGIYLSGSNNSIIIGTNATANYDNGIYLDNSSNNVVSGNNVTANGNAGIGIFLSSNNTVSNNKATANQGSGFGLSDSSNNTVTGNYATKSSGGAGIEVDFSINNTVSENNSTANYDSGIVLYNSSNNTVRGNNATANNVDGIDLESSSNDNTVNGNNATANSQYGISLFSSSGNVLIGNVIGGNEYNFGVGGVFNGFASSDFMNSVDTSNLVNGKPIYYLTGKSNMTINPENYPDVGYLAIVDCTNLTVQGLTLTSEGQGILLAFTNDSKITNNNATNDYEGITLYSSSNNTVSDNAATANGRYDIFLDNSSNNTVSGNNVTTSNVGIYLFLSNKNDIYHNNFVGNSFQASVGSTSVGNAWDNGYPSGGNFWSDYTGTDLYSGAYQNVTGSDGIGDTPYVIDANNTDNYPLMTPITIVPELADPLILATFMLTTLLAIAINKKRHSAR